MVTRDHVSLQARLGAMPTPDLLRAMAKHQRREEFVPEAYAAVQSILRRRGVAIEEAVASMLRDWPDPSAPVDLVVVATAFNPTKAQLIRMRLEEGGVEVHMADENLPRVHYGYGIAAGGVKILVRARDAEEARAILEQPPLKLHWPCPSCGSRNTSRDARLLRGITVAVGLMFATPEPQLARTGRCDACGHTWEDD